MEPENKIQHGHVQTFAEDMAGVLEGDREGLIKKIIHGEEEHEMEKRNLSPESKKNKFFLLISAILLVLGVALVLAFLLNKTDNTVPVAEQFVPLIFNDKSDFVEVADFNKDKIEQTIFNQTNGTDVKNGGVEGFYLTVNKQTVWLRQFIALIKGSFVAGNASVVGENFLMGVVNGKSKDFFILIKVRSLADVFDSLRAWENKMFFDLHGFFGVEISADTSYLLTKNFDDGVVENKNARILHDKDDNIVLMYIMADDDSIIITNTEAATHEIMLRLASSQVKK